MSAWNTMTFHDAGVQLIDCVHKTPAAQSEGYPYVGIPQMKSGRVEFSDARLISHVDYVEWTKKAKPQRDDVILSRRTNPGVIAIDGTDTPFALGQNLVLLRADGKSVHPPFLRWLCLSRAWWEQIEKYINVGAVFSSLRCGDVPKFELPIPPLDVQREIAGILGALDDKIELNRKTAATLEEMARALYRSWFVDFDPVHAKAAGRTPAHMGTQTAALFPDSFGEDGLPVGWKNAPLHELAQVTMGLSPKGSTYNDEGAGTPLCNGPVEYGEYFLRQIKWTTAPTRLAQRGDLIVCVRGSTTGRHAFADTEYCLGRGVAGVRGLDNTQEFVETSVLFHLERLLEKTTGSVFPSLSKNDIRDFEILNPGNELIREFCRVTRAMREQVWLKVEENQTLATLRDTLLPRLMSGELRVREAKEQVEDFV
ncbi:restriction endonuclease subunit S [Falsiruegeria litorea]|nr:restriction endonuclease subunit S [Falsiruegeria litorea]